MPTPLQILHATRPDGYRPFPLSVELHKLADEIAEHVGRLYDLVKPHHLPMLGNGNALCDWPQYEPLQLEYKEANFSLVGFRVAGVKLSDELLASGLWDAAETWLLDAASENDRIETEAARGY
jgi:hypothetical protein